MKRAQTALESLLVLGAVIIVIGVFGFIYLTFLSGTQNQNTQGGGAAIDVIKSETAFGLPLPTTVNSPSLPNSGYSFDPERLPAQGGNLTISWNATIPFTSSDVNWIKFHTDLFLPSDTSHFPQNPVYTDYSTDYTTDILPKYRIYTSGPNAIKMFMPSLAANRYFKITIYLKSTTQPAPSYSPGNIWVWKS